MYSRKEEIDYNEIFSPIEKQTSIKVVLAMVNLYDLELEH